MTSDLQGQASQLVKDRTALDPRYVEMSWNNAMFARLYQELPFHVEILLALHADPALIESFVDEALKQVCGLAREHDRHMASVRRLLERTAVTQ